VNFEYLAPLANHLWQSTLFAGIAGLLTLFLRNNRARSRHWVWLAASLKFLIPFSVLISLGGQIHWRTAPRAEQAGLSVVTEQSNLSVVMDEVSQPFTAKSASEMPSSQRPPASIVPSSCAPSGHAGSSASVVRGGFAGGVSALPSAPGRRCRWNCPSVPCPRRRVSSRVCSVCFVRFCCCRKASSTG